MFIYFFKYVLGSFVKLFLLRDENRENSLFPNTAIKDKITGHKE